MLLDSFTAVLLRQRRLQRCGSLCFRLQLPLRAERTGKCVCGQGAGERLRVPGGKAGAET